MKNEISLLGWCNYRNNRIKLVEKLIDTIKADIDRLAISENNWSQVYICNFLNRWKSWFKEQGVTDEDFNINGSKYKKFTNYYIWLGDVLPELVKYKDKLNDIIDDNSDVWFYLIDGSDSARLTIRLEALKKCLVDLKLNR